MKTNGATWKAYLASWPNGQWFDYSDETFDGKEPVDDKPADEAVVAFTCGVVFATESDHKGVSLTSHFRSWLKAQTHSNVMVSVPKDRLDELAPLLASINAKIIN